MDEAIHINTACGVAIIITDILKGLLIMIIIIREGYGSLCVCVCVSVWYQAMSYTINLNVKSNVLMENGFQLVNSAKNIRSRD